MATTWWSGWRRDLVVGLTASALTALPLFFIGRALLREEQGQTAVARDRAEQALRRAERSEAEAARVRARAEENFRTARRAVDDYLTAVTEREAKPPERSRQEL